MKKYKFKKPEPNKFSILCVFTVTNDHPYIDRIATNPYQARAPSLYSHVYNGCPSMGITLISRWGSPPPVQVEGGGGRGKIANCPDPRLQKSKQA